MQTSCISAEQGVLESERPTVRIPYQQGRLAKLHAVDEERELRRKQ